MGAWCGIGLLLQVLLSHHKPSLAYSLKNCTIEYFENATADVRLDCSSRHLVEVPRDIPRRANFVNLMVNKISRINKGDFSLMSELRTLWLDSNNISHVDDGSFVDLVALEELNMDLNQLTQLRANMFLGLSNLTMLSLRSNAINFIDSSAFHCLDRLQTLSLDSNQFKKVTDLLPVFGIPNLRRLDIRGNRFKDFQTKDLLLTVPSSVEELILSDNPLDKFSITTPVFPHLRLLDLARCRQDEALVWDIPDKTFLSNITNLTLGDYMLSYNEMQKVLKSLDSLGYLTLNYMGNLINKGILETVCKIPTLRKLDLYYHHVANISEKLANCSQLHELDLSMIGMTDISEGSLRAMKQLRYLKASSNVLTEVPQDIRDLSSLEILDLSGNLIAALRCGEFANTTNLTELYLSYNFVSKLDRCVFKTLKDLKILDLSNNLVWSFGDAFMSLQKLEFLDLSENQMVILKKGDFKGLSSLKYLALTSKHINRLKGNVFEGLDNLGNLSISLPLMFNNNLMKLKRLQNLTVYYDTDIAVGSFPSPNFKALHSLKYLKYFTVICKGYHFGFPLDVPQEIFHSMGHLEDFTAVNIYVSAPPLDTFQFTPQLRRLTIGMTDMSDLVSELFYPIPNLQALDLSGSHLKYLDFLAQANLSSLRWLKLSDNELTVINQTVLESLPALRYLDLSGNPFTCGCDNARFIEWVKMNNQTQVAGAYQYTCSFPVAERDRNLLDFDVQSCWEDTGYYFFICNTCLVLLMLVMSLTYHLLRWQFVYAFHLFLAFLYDGRRRKKAPHRYDAFVSYNVRDEAWVYQELLPRLEGEQGWRLCLHHRDFQPGKPIIENITDAIYGSRKTICVITQRYLQSEWCSREIQMASFRLLDEKKDVLILLFLEEIPARQLSPYYRMRKLVKRRTYLSWSQAGQHKGVFWQNVRRALETGEDAPAEGNDLLL